MNYLLIIEDDKIVGNIYRNRLTVEGFRVDLARDGETGLKMIESNPPDVVLLDLMMPKLTGVEVLRAMRSRPETESIPVVVLSNTYMTSMVQEAWKAGASKCLSKTNCTPREVIEAVRSVMPKPKPPSAPPPPASVTPAPDRSADPDAEFQADLRHEFLETLPATLAALRGHLQALLQAGSETARLKQMQDFYRRVHSLTSNAGVAGLALISQMAHAFEALLKELYEKPVHLNPSALRTLTLAVDFLAYLFEHGTLPDRQGIPAANILVVDDEILSRRAIIYALDKAKLKSVSVEDAATALRLLAESPFDLVFLDVDIPDIGSFEFCNRLRELPTQQKTPVVFVTYLSEYESYADRIIGGGNDLIAKPFLFIELAVRALIYVLRGRLESARGVREAKTITSA